MGAELLQGVWPPGHRTTTGKLDKVHKKTRWTSTGNKRQRLKWTIDHKNRRKEEQVDTVSQTTASM